MESWTFDGYWNAVLGANRSAEDIVQEFELCSVWLDVWLGLAESEAAAMGRIEIPKEWSGYHARALEMLEDAMSQS